MRRYSAEDGIAKTLHDLGQRGIGARHARDIAAMGRSNTCEKASGNQQVYKWDQKKTDMNDMLTAANKNFRSIGGNFTNFYGSASSFDSVGQEIYSQQAFYIYYTCPLREPARSDSMPATGLLSAAHNAPMPITQPKVDTLAAGARACSGIKICSGAVNTQIMPIQGNTNTRRVRARLEPLALPLQVWALNAWGAWAWG